MLNVHTKSLAKKDTSPRTSTRVAILFKADEVKIGSKN